MTTKATFNSLDDLFAANIEDLADLASFETPPPGSYILDVSVTTKKAPIKGVEKDCIETSFTVVETVELTDATGGTKPVAVGTKFSTLTQLDNEYAVGNFKKLMVPFAEHFATPNMGVLIREHMQNVRIACLVKNRKDKIDKDKVYGTVTQITVA